MKKSKCNFCELLTLLRLLIFCLDINFWSTEKFTSKCIIVHEVVSRQFWVIKHNCCDLNKAFISICTKPYTERNGIQSELIHFLRARIFFWQKWLFGQKWLLGRNGCLAETVFRPKILLSNLKWLFGKKWLFSNESALLLKVLKGLARLWWLKAFRLVFLAKGGFRLNNFDIIKKNKSESFQPLKASQTFQYLEK